MSYNSDNICNNNLKNEIHKPMENIDTTDIFSSLDSKNSLDNEEHKCICNTCKSQFKNKITLNLHQKTTKCKLNDDKDKKCCKYCNKVISSKQMKLYHYNNCLEKIKYDIKMEYEDKLNKLKIEYENKLNDMKQYYENKL